MPPRVTIQTNGTLDDYYEQILRSVDQRFHNYKTNFPRYPTTEAEYGELETNTAHAAHAGDLYDDKGVHLERRLG